MTTWQTSALLQVQILKILEVADGVRQACEHAFLVDVAWDATGYYV